MCGRERHCRHHHQYRRNPTGVAAKLVNSQQSQNDEERQQVFGPHDRGCEQGRRKNRSDDGRSQSYPLIGRHDPSYKQIQHRKQQGCQRCVDDSRPHDHRRLAQTQQPPGRQQDRVEKGVGRLLCQRCGALPGDGSGHAQICEVVGCKQRTGHRCGDPDADRQVKHGQAGENGPDP